MAEHILMTDTRFNFIRNREACCLIIASVKLFLPLLLFLIIATNNKNTGFSDQLCKDNEAVIYSFPLTNGKKIVSICKEIDAKYLVYQFGTKTNVELEFPDYFDEYSWKRFSLYADIFQPQSLGPKVNYSNLTLAITFTITKFTNTEMVWPEKQRLKSVQKESTEELQAAFKKNQPRGPLDQIRVLKRRYSVLRTASTNPIPDFALTELS